MPVAAHYCPLLSIVAHCCPFCCPSLAARPTNRGERRPLKSLSKIKKNIESTRNIVNQEELKKKPMFAAQRRQNQTNRPTTNEKERRPVVDICSLTPLCLPSTYPVGPGSTPSAGKESRDSKLGCSCCPSQLFLGYMLGVSLIQRAVGHSSAQSRI